MNQQKCNIKDKQLPKSDNLFRTHIANRHTQYSIPGPSSARKSDISDGNNSTISFARSFTHRRRKTRYILLLCLAEFTSTSQYVYQITRVNIELRKTASLSHWFIYCFHECV